MPGTTRGMMLATTVAMMPVTTQRKTPPQASESALHSESLVQDFAAHVFPSHA
jgi:hypothetical protein